MFWYQEILENIEKNKTYEYKELVEALKNIRGGLSESSYLWAVRKLVQDGDIEKQGYNSYSLAMGISATGYNPEYSDTAKNLIKLIEEKFPHVSFTIFETALMNDFLNHMIAQNTIFVQVEKESSIYVFRFLQEEGIKDILYKPDEREYNLYWSKDCIVVTDMVSEAPLRKAETHEITLEKMLVDMSADKLIADSYSKAEFPDVLEEAKSRYCLDETRMLRYARRRNRQELIKNILNGDGDGNVVA